MPDLDKTAIRTLLIRMFNQIAREASEGVDSEKCTYKVADMWADMLVQLGGGGGGTVYMRVDGGFIQYSNDNATWSNVIAVAVLVGATGKNIELNKSATHLQWRVVGDADWINLVALADIKGDAGANGDSMFEVISDIISPIGNLPLKIKSFYNNPEFDNGNSGSAINIDFPTNGKNQKVTLTDNCTYTLSDLPADVTAHLQLRVIQGGAGSYSLSHPASVKEQNGAFDYTTGVAGTEIYINYYWNGSKFIVLNTNFNTP